MSRVGGARSCSQSEGASAAISPSIWLIKCGPRASAGFVRVRVRRRFVTAENKMVEDEQEIKQATVVEPLPTHVLVGYSDGETLKGERFVTIREFVDVLLKHPDLREALRGPPGPPGITGMTGAMGPPGLPATLPTSSIVTTTTK